MSARDIMDTAEPHMDFVVQHYKDLLPHLVEFIFTHLLYMRRHIPVYSFIFLESLAYLMCRRPFDRICNEALTTKSAVARSKKVLMVLLALNNSLLSFVMMSLLSWQIYECFWNQRFRVRIYILCSEAL